MLHLEKTPMTNQAAGRFADSSRSATLPNRTLGLITSNHNNSLSSNSSQLSTPDKNDIALLQEQYHLAYEGRQSLQRKCNALEELLEQLKADRDQLQRTVLQTNAELVRLRAVTVNTVPKADFETLQQQTATLTPQLEELGVRERRLIKELEEHQAVVRQLQDEIADLQEENDQLKTERATMEKKQAAIESTILELDRQSGEQHKELEYLRTQLVKSEEESSGLRSVVSQLADSRLCSSQLRSLENRFNSSTVSLVSNLSTNVHPLSQASSINTLTSCAGGVQPSLPPFNRRSMSAAPTRKAHHPVSRASSITTTTSPSSVGNYNHHHHHNNPSNYLGESMAVVRTRDLELQLEERELELQQLREQLDQADGESRTLKEQSALDKERIQKLEQELKEVQSRWSVLVMQNTASAEDLNNNEEKQSVELETEEQEEPAESAALNEKLDALNNNTELSNTTKKPKKPSRRWYCIFTVCVTSGKQKQPPTKGSK